MSLVSSEKTLTSTFGCCRLKAMMAEIPHSLSPRCFFSLNVILWPQFLTAFSKRSRSLRILCVESSSTALPQFMVNLAGRCGIGSFLHGMPQAFPSDGWATRTLDVRLRGRVWGDLDPRRVGDGRDPELAEHRPVDPP